MILSSLLLYFCIVTIAAPLWTAHPDCPEHVKTDLEARVRSLPSSLNVPVAGEVFDNADICQERLQDWALSQGFAIVRKAQKSTYNEGIRG
jgi:hypothetical protein